MATDVDTGRPAPEGGAGQAASGSEPALRKNAVGFLSNLTMGVASAAPAYSAALTIGLLAAVAGMGFQTPAIVILSFIPLYLTAAAYRALNSERPDCGTTFAWAARALSPVSGWLGGWALLLAYSFVLGIGASLAATYFFLMVGWESAAGSVWATTATGVAVIAVSFYLCLIGVDISARAQRWLLYLEMAALGVFAVVALAKGFTGADGYVQPQLSWFSPFAINSWSTLVDGVLLGVFMYWGWEASVAVAEESEHETTGPGRAVVLSVIGLVLTYLAISVAAQSVRGPGFLAEHNEDVLSATAGVALGNPLDKVVLFAVCTSAVAGSLTSMIITSRTAYSMARARALPGPLGKVHPRWQTPWVANIVVALIGATYFVLLTAVSEDFLTDSVEGVGLLVVFFYAMTAIASAVYFRRRLGGGIKVAWRYVLAPAIGGLMLAGVFVKAAIDAGKADAGTLGTVFGIGTPLAIAAGSLLVGLLLCLGMKMRDRTFFEQPREAAPAEIPPS